MGEGWGRPRALGGDFREGRSCSQYSKHLHPASDMRLPDAKALLRAGGWPRLGLLTWSLQLVPFSQAVGLKRVRSDKGLE